MAGPDPNGFSATKVRAAIRQAMSLARANTEPDQVTFRWDPDRKFTITDPAGHPYDWKAPSLDVPHPDVVVDCVVEYSARPAGSRDAAVGHFDSSRVIVYVLDEDFDLLTGASEIIVGQQLYLIEFLGPPIALFSMQMYAIYADARDQAPSWSTT